MKRLLRRFLLLAGIVSALFIFRHPLMTAAARGWILYEPLEKSDAAVVLGGSTDTRPFYAADIYKRGLVPKVLVTEVRRGDAALLNLLPSDTDVSAGVLQKMGVPDSAVEHIGTGVNSTRDEAVALREWLGKHPAKRIIIATDPFHARRVRFIFERELKGLPVELTVTGIPSKKYDPLYWWESEEATLAFQNEVIKLAYYWLRR